MPNIKKITCDWSTTGLTVYSIVRRETDSYRLNDADGSFASNPADPYVSLTEDSIIKGRYEVSESRAVWNDGLYTITVYKQTGGSPVPVSDTIIGTGKMYIVSDAEVVLDASVSTKIPTALSFDGAYIQSQVKGQDNVDFGELQKASITAAVPTTAQIQAEMEENGASILDTLADKLPTNYIMGSSVQSAKDDEIDAIKIKTDNLPEAKTG